jgi:hypothetical protein
MEIESSLPCSKEPFLSEMNPVHLIPLRYISILFFHLHISLGAPGSVVLKALCYKSESRGFDS